MVIAKGSRYESAKEFAGENGKEPVFGGIRPRKIGSAAGVLEYTVKQGDRLDLLSLHFYNNTQRWFRILDANPQVIFGADLMLEQYIGETILIPRSRESGGGQ
jgi:nucleoid-associated protein YgaU